MSLHRTKSPGELDASESVQYRTIVEIRGGGGGGGGGSMGLYPNLEGLVIEQ